jgi:hypothetical protein
MLGFHPAPILLGFVLGPRFEENFRRAMLISRGNLGVADQRLFRRDVRAADREPDLRSGALAPIIKSAVSASLKPETCRYFRG